MRSKWCVMEPAFRRFHDVFINENLSLLRHQGYSTVSTPFQEQTHNG